MLHVLSEIGIPGWAPVGPFIYDLDDDDFIGPGDLSLFACCWLHLASDSGCFGLLPCIDCDFDCDGFVGPGDLSWFATGWLKRCDDPSVLWPPCQGGASGNTWTVRFTPYTAGQWKYVASFRKGKNIAVNLQRDAGQAVDFDDFCFLAAHWLECTLPVCD
jgi:hypothetical protein